MRHILLALFITLILSTNLVLASHPQGTISIQVYGLVCDFCARSIEKVFGKEDAVQDIKVDLDAKNITIHLNQGFELSDATITKYINDSGYNIVEIHRGE